DTTIHRPSTVPMGPSSERSPYTPVTSARPSTTDSARPPQMRARASPSWPRFQRANVPSDTSASSGSTGSRNIELKYGGPTDSVPRPVASAISGASVPPNTTAVATTSRMLLNSRKLSRDTRSKPAEERSSGARHTYSASEPPMVSTRKARMNRPLPGSAAKLCTEVSTPERTMKVASRQNENVMMASSSVQLLNRPRLSVTASEWISAVPSSHGIRME